MNASFFDGLLLARPGPYQSGPRVLMLCSLCETVIGKGGRVTRQDVVIRHYWHGKICKQEILPLSWVQDMIESSYSWIVQAPPQ